MTIFRDQYYLSATTNTLIQITSAYSDSISFITSAGVLDHVAASRIQRDIANGNIYRVVHCEACSQATPFIGYPPVYLCDDCLPESAPLNYIDCTSCGYHFLDANPGWGICEDCYWETIDQIQADYLARLHRDHNYQRHLEALAYTCHDCGDDLSPDGLCTYCDLPKAVHTLRIGPFLFSLARF